MSALIKLVCLMSKFLLLFAGLESFTFVASSKSNDHQQVYSPTFTYHGFRFVELTGDHLLIIIIFKKFPFSFYKFYFVFNDCI